MGRTIIEMDGKEHQKHRSIVQYAFHFKSIAPLESYMTEVVHELIDGFAARRPRRPGRALHRAVSDSRDRAHRRACRSRTSISSSSTRSTSSASPRIAERGLAASRAVREFLLPIIAERRAAPIDDVLSRLVTGEVDGQRLTDEEIVSFMRLLLPAGAETTFRLIGSTLFALLHHPEQLAELVADRTLGARRRSRRRCAGRRRCCSSAARRRVRSSSRGWRSRQGAMVTPVIGSANRDESHYGDPDRWDLHRGADDHLSFGGGRHFCLGYHLARMEARIALDAVLDRLPNLRLDLDASGRRSWGSHSARHAACTSISTPLEHLPTCADGGAKAMIEQKRARRPLHGSAGGDWTQHRGSGRGCSMRSVRSAVRRGSWSWRCCWWPIWPAPSSSSASKPSASAW